MDLESHRGYPETGVSRGGLQSTIPLETTLQIALTEGKNFNEDGSIELRLAYTPDLAPATGKGPLSSPFSPNESILGPHKKTQSALQESIFIAIICGAQFITQAGLGMAIAPLHIIGDSFAIQNAGELSWVAASYSLTVGTFILIAGRLGDVYGHKKFFVAGFLWFALWSTIAGFSVFSNQILLDCSRAFQGIGAAFFMPNAIAILGRTYEPGQKKGMIFALFGACAPSGFVIGGLFASLLAERLWWPWAFWIMAIACVVFALAGQLVLPHMPSPKVSGSVLARLDVAGSVTGVVGLFLINFAWNQGPAVGWQTPYTYILLILGFLVMGIFVYVERHVKFPLVPLKIMTVETGFVLSCVAAGWSSFGIWVFYSWEFVEVLRGHSPLLASVQFLPATLSGFVAALMTGFILKRFHPSVVMVVSSLAFMIGTILVATAPIEQTYWAQLFVSTIVMPWGMDMSFPAATMLLSDAMHHDHQGTAASLVTTIINYSISIGLGIAATVERQIDSDGTELLKSYRSAWYTGIGLSGVGVAISLLFVLSHYNSSWSKDASLVK